MVFRKLLLFTAVLLLALSAGTACALELSADEIVPFGQNTVIVRSDTAGSLTLTPSLPDYDLMPAVTELAVEAGETSVSWDGLSWYGEPLPPGKLALNARLQDASGAVTEASLEIRVSSPLCAAVSCLPAADIFCPSEETLRIECGLSRKGTVKLEIASAGLQVKMPACSVAEIRIGL